MKKLAECLLRRKELQQKIDRIGGIKDKDLFEVKARRQAITDSIEEVVAQVPKVALKDVTKEYDYYARQLRLIDAAIQQKNWTAEVEGVDNCFNDFE